ncbi:hypothetical protein CHS0354_023298 [Potamilus streckersoni]|uniref:Probable ATP-dependent DNA helicase HFM1 n=1 Tax=Potamilus streckersoni TaxID=2493646 RepID=A0AAE0W7W4_9BIVA|nr:hypothetical protein CHS0354_023298 [Potamilus streckersoni]
MYNHQSENSEVELKRYSNEGICLQSQGPCYGVIPDAPAVGDLSLLDGTVSEQDLSLSQIFHPSQKPWGLSQRQCHLTQQQSQLLQKQSQLTHQQCQPMQRQFHLSQKQCSLMGPPCMTQLQRLPEPKQQHLLHQKNVSSQRHHQLLQQDYRKPLSHSPESRPKFVRYNANLHPRSRGVDSDVYNNEQHSENWTGEDQSVAESVHEFFTGDADLFEDREENTPAIRVRSGMKKDMYTPAPLIVPSNSRSMKLRSVKEIPEKCRSVFNFPYFNCVQTKVFDDVLFSDKSVVLCAPTGAGKTVVFEMAITRLLTVQNQATMKCIKIVYMAPIKALCSERYQDWKQKFEPLGLKCKELTGDTELEDFYELQEVNIILTTPEKWDSMTRRWRDNKSVIQSICLFLIDEIHVLSDITRGATVEAVIARMKTIQAAKARTKLNNPSSPFRYIAVSATIPNIEDIAEWLGDNKKPALYFKMDESSRPVRLKKIVIGYNFDEHRTSLFQFDLMLSYRLAGIIHTYSDGKPTLVFCASRKGAQQAAEIIAKDPKGFIHSSKHQLLTSVAYHMKDTKLRDLVMKGIGYHHAGMDLQDRKNIEELFYNGELLVLVSTSTLAMGVNLPAHLVIIKSTMYYQMGVNLEYSDSQILQMIGRAGRPQFDTSSTAVILTKNQTKGKYEALLNGTQVIESSLHKNLIEHLQAEIVLHTINDISVAVEWLRYTFLYIRVMKNPQFYGMPNGLSKEQIEKRLHDLCMKNLNLLTALNMTVMDEETFDIKPTDAGRLMARYCISFETMKLFSSITGTESIHDLILILCKSEEISELKIRNSEKKTLNMLNKDKNKTTIRYPLQGRVKTTEMKINCLIQATLGCLPIQDFGLQQDTSRLFRAGQRITRCLVELLWLRQDYKSLLSAVQLTKCFKAHLWEDSKFVAKQFSGIGPTLSNMLVNAGIVSFQKIEETNPRDLELIVNRHPPFGNQIHDMVARLPKYELVIEQIAHYSMRTSEIVLTLTLANRLELQHDKKPAAGNSMTPNHCCVLLVGDVDNKVVFKRKIMDHLLLKEEMWTKKLEIKRSFKGPDLYISYISLEWVGLDIETVYTPYYLDDGKTLQRSIRPSAGPDLNETQDKVNEVSKEASQGHKPDDAESTMVPCNHSCRSKAYCRHDCCKTGVPAKRKLSRPGNAAVISKRMTTEAQSSVHKICQTAGKSVRGPTNSDFSSLSKTPRSGSGSNVAKLIRDMRSRLDSTPNVDSLAGQTRPGRNSVDLSHFAYTSSRSAQPFHREKSDESISSKIPRLEGSNDDWAELDIYQRLREELIDEEIMEDMAGSEDHPDLCTAQFPLDKSNHTQFQLSVEADHQSQGCNTNDRIKDLGRNRVDEVLHDVQWTTGNQDSHFTADLDYFAALEYQQRKNQQGFLSSGGYSVSDDWPSCNSELLDSREIKPNNWESYQDHRMVQNYNEGSFPCQRRGQNHNACRLLENQDNKKECLSDQITIDHLPHVNFPTSGQYTRQKYTVDKQVISHQNQDFEVSLDSIIAEEQDVECNYDGYVQVIHDSDDCKDDDNSRCNGKRQGDRVNAQIRKYHHRYGQVVAWVPSPQGKTTPKSCSSLDRSVDKDQWENWSNESFTLLSVDQQSPSNIVLLERWAETPSSQNMQAKSHCQDVTSQKKNMKQISSSDSKKKERFVRDATDSDATNEAKSFSAFFTDGCRPNDTSSGSRSNFTSIFEGIF